VAVAPLEEPNSGGTIDDVYRGDEFQRPEHGAKAVPWNIERRVFRATRVTGYRLKQAA